jgi:hypothetical protein
VLLNEFMPFAIWKPSILILNGLGCVTEGSRQHPSCGWCGCHDPAPKKKRHEPVPDKLLWITITNNVVRSGPRVSSCVGDGCNVKNAFHHRGVNVALLLCSAWREAILFGSDVTDIYQS